MASTGPWIYPDWPAPASVHAAVTTRNAPGISPQPFARCNLGVRNGDRANAVAANREGLVAALGLPSVPRWLHQVHGNRVADLGPSSAAVEEPQVDAAVSRIRGTVLAILSADCLPLLLAARDGSVIAVAHAGWRGLAGGVLEASVAATGVAPGELLAWIGPCIGAVSYEVGGEVRDAMLAVDSGADAMFAPTRPGHWVCDLAGLARARLCACGVGSIHGGGFDTFADRRFYSYRRDGAASGRFASLIWMDA